MKSKKKMNLYIMDIDGCVSESCFPNTFDEVQDINTYRENILKSNFFSAFLKFYEKIKDSNHTFFVTGRTREYKDVTITNFRKLGNPKIYFQLGNKEFSKEAYINYKINTISNIIENHPRASETHIFDDKDHYFEKVKERNPKRDITFYNFKSNQDWKTLIREKF